MSDMTTKRLMMAGALAALAASPVSAQIAKFHLTTPALPGAVTLDRIASAAARGVFHGSTGEMNQERAASLSEMRGSNDIVARDSQDIRDDGGNDLLGSTDAGTDDHDGNRGIPRDRPVMASAEPVDDLPDLNTEVDRQVIVRTRTKTPRGGSKIKTGTIWSVGEFR